MSYCNYPLSNSLIHNTPLVPCCHTAITTHTHTHHCRGQRSPSPLSIKDKVKTEREVSPASNSSDLFSPGPKEAQLAASDHDPSKLPDDSRESLSSLPSSPSDDCLGGSDEFTKLSVYSPTQEQFSIPEDIATEAQSTTSLASISEDVQGAKHFNMADPEYSVSSTSEPPATNYFSASARGYSYLPSTISPNSLINPVSSYHIPQFNPTFSGSAEGGMVNGSSVYPNAACVSPTTYMSPYGAHGKQYTWPTTPNAVNYGAFGMASHDLMPNGYGTASYQQNYSQVARSNYPATAYFPATQMPATTSPTC